MFLFRHGEAEPLSSIDADRELTASGEADNKIVVNQLLQRQTEIEVMLCSPYRRAQQTASGLIAAVPTMRSTETDLLVPDSNLNHLLSHLDRLSAANNISSLILVGHNPLLSDLLTLLVDGGGLGNYHLETSNIVCLNVDVLSPACADIEYRISPRS